MNAQDPEKRTAEGFSNDEQNTTTKHRINPNVLSMRRAGVVEGRGLTAGQYEENSPLFVVCQRGSNEVQTAPNNDHPQRRLLISIAHAGYPTEY